MYNHYQGNTGRVRRVDDGDSPSAARQLSPAAGQSPAPGQGAPAGQSPASASPGRAEPRQNAAAARQAQPPAGTDVQRPEKRPISAPGPGSKRPAGPLTGLSGELGRLLKRLSPMNLETEDLILAMMLYLMYRDSKDEELLYIMAAMFLL